MGADDDSETDGDLTGLENEQTVGTWQPDPGDAVSTDLTSTVDAEDLDEDMLDADPLEVDAPDRWAPGNDYGLTPAEEQRGESLDQRLAEEEPDLQPEESQPPEGRGTR